MPGVDFTNLPTASVPTPSPGVTSTFVDDTSKTLCSKDDAGLVTDYGAGASTVVVANEATDTTCFPVFVTAATGSLGAKSNAALTFNSNVPSLACTTFVGALTGNATTATAAASTTVANEATDTTCFVLFVTAATGDLASKSNANLAFNSNTGVLTLTAPILGTPTSGTLTNCSGLPISTGVSGLGTNVAHNLARGYTVVTQAAQPAINIDTTLAAHITGLAQAITSMSANLTGTPQSDDILRIDITDDGTARAIAWGTSFESSGTVTLPTTTVVNTRMDIGFVYNLATTKWRCVAVA